MITRGRKGPCSGRVLFVFLSLQPVTLYLVKWCSLPYEDSTWELKADTDQAKIEEFERVMAREPGLTRVVRPGILLDLALFSILSAERTREGLKGKGKRATFLRLVKNH